MARKARGEENQGIILTGGFDRELISPRGGSARYLVVNAAAPKAPEAGPSRRIPLNLAIVIDVSGSMGGENIESAKEAARGIVECLHDDDLLTLVSFDSGVYLHLPGAEMKASMRQKALEAIASMRAGSCTNLSGGWVQGAECLAEVMTTEPGRANRIILLTDGHANVGIVDPEELAALAAGYREQGIYSSTVGIGDGYETAQIEAIATHGGGTLHDAERPHEIVEVVMAELGESLKTYAHNVKLQIEGPSGVRYEVVGPFPASKARGLYTCALGSLVYGRAVEVVIRLMLPNGDDGSALDFNVSASYQELDRGERTCALPPLELQFVVSQRREGQPRHEERTLSVITAWHRQIIRKAVQLNRSGKGASDFVRRELKHFRQYCAGIEGVDKELGELERLVSRIARPMRERARKEVELASLQCAYAREDFRSEVRAPVDAFLFEEE